MNGRGNPACGRVPAEGCSIESEGQLAYYANRVAHRAKAMPTRNVVLTDRQAELVERLVADGRYQNASEVMREGLRLVEDKEERAKAQLRALREAARIGIADIENGRYRTFANSADVNRHLEALREKALAKKSAR